MSTTTWKRERSHSWSSRAGVGVAAVSIAAATVVAPAALEAPASGAAAVSHFSGGGVTIPGRRWLQGQGVNVIRSRQCTELASRLYSVRKWGNITNFYGMRANRKYGPLTFKRNGSGYRPVPGDVLVELGGPYQHVAVVNRVVGGRIYTAEQNATPSATHIYKWNGRKAAGAYRNRYVGGFIHSDRNPFSPKKLPARHR